MVITTDLGSSYGDTIYEYCMEVEGNMTEAKHLDCILVEDDYVNVIVIKKVPYTESDGDAVNRAIKLLREV